MYYFVMKNAHMSAVALIKNFETFLKRKHGFSKLETVLEMRCNQFYNILKMMKTTTRNSNVIETYDYC